MLLHSYFCRAVGPSILRSKALQLHMAVNLQISPPHQAKSTLSTPIYSTSHSIQEPGVGSFDASRRVALGSGWVKNKNNYFLNYGR